MLNKNKVKSIASRLPLIRDYHTLKNGGAAKFYSSCGEDALLIRLFVNKYRGTIIKDGFYVDIGAHHYKYASNTYALYKLGWRGINIEANPSAIPFFMKKRSKDINLNFAVGKNTEEVDFYLFGNEKTSRYSSSSTTDIDFKRNIEEQQGLLSKCIKVQGRRLDDILSEYNSKQIDFMNIDVESKELDVLESNNWNQYRPLIIAVEILPLHKSMNIRSIINDSDVFRYLENYNYICFSHTLFTFFFYDSESNGKDVVENWAKCSPSA